MRRGDIAAGIVVHFIGIKRKILIDLRALCPARPAVHKPARRVIGRNGHNVRPDLQEGGKEVVPVLPRILELSLERRSRPSFRRLLRSSSSMRLLTSSR